MGPAPSCCHLSPPAQLRTPHLQLWLGPPALGSLREQGSGRGWSLVLRSHGEREGGGQAGGRAQAGRPKPLPGARSAHWYHSPAPGYVNSGMSIFSRRRFHPDPRQRAGCEGPPAPHLAVSRDLDPRQAQDRGGGLYQICTRLNRPPRINWQPRKPELLAGGGY